VTAKVITDQTDQAMTAVQRQISLGASSSHVSDSTANHKYTLYIHTHT